MKKMKTLLLLAGVFLCFTAIGQNRSNHFQNPVISGFHPDPSVCRVGDDYYLATSSFQYWPGIPVFHSKDLVNWKPIGHCITRKSQADLSGIASSDGLWAPTLRYHDGVFYMIVSNVQRSPWKPVNFFVTATDPAGPWSEPVFVEEGTGIDPDLFFDDDGKAYYLRNDSKGIVLSEIDLSTGDLIGEFHTLWGGTGAPHPEAPHLYKIDDYYYLVLAEGGTGPYHRSTIARSKHLTDGYKAYPFNPILGHIERFEHPIQATGHGDLIQAHDDSWWFFFLAKRSNSFESFNSVLGRETFLAPVRWTHDEWPVIGNRGHVEPTMEGPDFYTPKSEKFVFRDDFEDENPGLHWNFLRYPRKENYSRATRSGQLILQGDSLSLDDVGSPTFVGVRQKHFDCTVTTSMEFNPVESTDEAGVAVYMEEKHYCSIGLTLRNGQHTVVVHARVGNLKGELGSISVDSGNVFFKVVASEDYYRFYCSEDQEIWHFAGEMETRYLEPPQYTGMYLGLYATGNGNVSKEPSKFNWFEYREELSQKCKIKLVHPVSKESL